MTTPRKSETDAAWIASQLRKTQAEMELLQKRSQGEFFTSAACASPAENDPLDKTSDLMRSGVVNPEQKLQRLSELDASLEYLELLSEFSAWEEDNKISTSVIDNVVGALSDCVQLTNLLIRFPPHWKHASSLSKNLKKLHQIIWNRYMSILQSTKKALSTQIQRSFTETGYPNESSCFDLLSQRLLDANEENEEDLSLPFCCSQLVTLQAIHEHFIAASSTSHRHLPWQRMDIVTEFCRPIVIRVRYHFTSSSPEFTEDLPAKRVATSTQSLKQRGLSNRYDRIVEWLLSFLRESMRAPLELLRRCIDDIVRRGWKDAMGMVCSSRDIGGFQLPPPAPAFQYFLREMVLLARHVLQGSGQNGDESGGVPSQQSSALCTILSDEVLFSTSMEQMLRFDEYIMSECAQNAEVETATLANDRLLSDVTPLMAPIPRLTGIVTYQHDRFCRWMELEHDSAMFTLSSASLAGMDHQDAQKLNAEVIANIPFPPFVETLVSLLYSADLKCRVAFSPLVVDDTKNRSISVPLEANKTSNYHLIEFINGLHVPLVMSYLDVTRTWANRQVRLILNCVQRSLRPVASKSWSGTASNSPSISDQIPISVQLKRLLRDYCQMIGGATCVASLLSAQALYWENIEMSQVYGRLGNHFPPSEAHSNAASSSSILKRMNDSVSRLSAAMVEELATAIVESMAVDDANVASYLMRIHYILREASYGDIAGGAGRLDTAPLPMTPVLSWDRKTTSESECRSPKVSKELVDFLPTLSDVVTSLNAIAHDHSLCVCMAAEVTKSNLANGLSTKLIDVILDVPEINSIQGAHQLSVDVQTIAAIFSSPSRLQRLGACDDGSFDRLLEILKLMTLESHQFVSLRDAFSNLVVGYDHGYTTDYAGIDIILENLTSDVKVMEQANDMLRAKGFISLELRDALVVLYSRSD